MKRVSLIFELARSFRLFKYAILVCCLCSAEQAAYAKGGGRVDMQQLMRERRVGDFGGTDLVDPYVLRQDGLRATEVQFDPERLNHVAPDFQCGLENLFHFQSTAPPGSESLTSEALEKAGRWAEAISARETELMQSPSLAVNRKNLSDALIRYGRYLEKLKQTDAAVHQFRRAMFVDPEAPVIVESASVCKSYPEPKADVTEKVIEQSLSQVTMQLLACPTDTRTRKCLARWYVFYGDRWRSWGQTYKAGLQYRRALFVDRDFSDAYKRLGPQVMFDPGAIDKDAVSPLPQ